MSDIQYGDKWEKDKLKRKNDADYLSSYLVSKHEQTKKNLKNGSFVLNINAEWGFGKTYLLKNWADDLAHKNHPVVYYDAWENDFSKEPLLAFISTINEQLSPYFDKKIGEKRGAKVKHFLESWYKSGKKLVTPSLPLIYAVMAKKVAGMSLDELSELMDEEVDNEAQGSSDSEKDIKNTVASVVSKTATKMMESHSSTKRTINEFKMNLGKLTNHLDSLETINLPMFIFIDELDRCRPNYAIEVLENIKHLFGVQGVFFIVATASEQLTHSIKAIYGQDFDSPNYLKRFFDQTYTLQDPDRYSYTEYLFSKYELAERENLYSPIEANFYSDNNPLIVTFSLITSLFDSGLRDMEQYCIVIDSICLTFKKEKIHIFYLLFLLIIKDKNSSVYKDIVHGKNPEFNKLNVNHSVQKKNVITFENRSGKAQITYFQILDRYFNYSKKDLPSISKEDFPPYRIINNIRDTLLEKLPFRWSDNDKPQNYLSDYPLLIEQAGKIT